MIDSGTTYTYILASEYKVLHSALLLEINNAMATHHVNFPKVTRQRVFLFILSLILVGA